MTTQNEVRQVLMNELGLTRDSIRDECAGIIEKTVEKEIRRYIDSKVFQGLIEHLIRKALTNDPWDTNPIYRLVIKCATEQVNEFVKDNLKFVVPPPASAIKREDSPNPQS